MNHGKVIVIECPRLHDIAIQHAKNCLCICDYCIDLRDKEVLQANYKVERAELVKDPKGKIID